MSELALGRFVSEETRLKRSEALNGRTLSESTKEKISNYKHTEQAKLKISLGNPRTKSVQIIDSQTNNIITFSTMTLAAAYLNTTTATIRSYIETQKLYKDRYLISILSKTDS